MKQTMLGVIGGAALCGAIFVAPIWVLMQQTGTPSTCVENNTCDPSHFTMEWGGSITYYGK